MVSVTDVAKNNVLRAINTGFHKSYYLEDKDVSFINFVDLSESECLEVLAWRNHPQLRRCMYRKKPIAAAEHFRFLDNLPNQNRQFYWVVREKGIPLGVIDIVNYHPLLNTMTVGLKPADLIKFIESTGHEAHIVDLSPAKPEEA